MASALVQDNNKAPHQCGICLEPLNNPCELPCLHLFCEECLARWAKINTTHDNILTCPNCRQSAQIPAQGISGFPTPFLIGQIQETGAMVEAKQQTPEILCENCEEPDKKSSVYCQNCKHYLCDTCQNIHGAWKSMKHHKFVALADIPLSEASNHYVEDKHCSEHDNNEKTSFCKTCDKLVCNDCINSEKHCQDHDATTMKEAAEIKLKVLKKEMKTCEAKKLECQDALKKVGKIEDNICNSTDKIKHELNTAKVEYIKVVEDAFETLNGDLERLKVEQISKLADMKYCLEGKMTAIESISDQSDNLVATGSHYKIVSMPTTHMLQSFKKISKMHINEVDEKQYQFPITFTIPRIKYKVRQPSGLEVRINLRESNLTRTGNFTVQFNERN